MRFKQRDRSAQMDKNDDGRCNGHRSRGVNRNAQRAVVGVGILWMDVRHLDDGQQRQHHQTHHRRHYERSLCLLLPVPFCAPCQQHHPLT